MIAPVLGTSCPVRLSQILLFSARPILGFDQMIVALLFFSSSSVSHLHDRSCHHPHRDHDDDSCAQLPGGPLIVMVISSIMLIILPLIRCLVGHSWTDSCPPQTLAVSTGGYWCFYDDENNFDDNEILPVQLRAAKHLPANNQQRQQPCFNQVPILTIPTFLTIKLKRKDNTTPPGRMTRSQTAASNNDN